MGELMHSLTFGIKLVSAQPRLALFFVCAQHGHLLINRKVN